MNKKVIINADDFGVVPSIDEAITEAVLAGKVNSVAAFSNYEHSVANVKALVAKATAAGKFPEIGVHLTISSGKPLLDATKDPAKGLCDSAGNFKSFKNVANAAIDTDVLKNELLAQVKRFTDNGIDVRHISCHHNTLMFFEKLFKVYVEVAIACGVRMRSVDIHPVQKNNFYVKVFLGMKLKEDNTRDDMRVMRTFVGEMKQKFALYSNNTVKCPGYLESAYYGPLPPVMIRRSAFNKQIADKKAKLISIVERFGGSEYGSMEFMLHLRKGDVSLFEKYRDEVAATRYEGIDPGYFDSRTVEFHALMQSDLTYLFQSNGLDYGSWNDV